MKQEQLTMAQLSERWKKDVRTVRRYVAAGMPCTGRRKTLRFDLNQVERWRSSNVVPRMARTRSIARRVPPAASMLRRCIACDALYRADTAERVADSPNPQKYCSDDCARDVGAGLSQAQIRDRIRGERLQAGWTKRELRDPKIWLDWVGPTLTGDCYASEEECLRLPPTCSD
jgi:hypothetical protein